MSCPEGRFNDGLPAFRIDGGGGCHVTGTQTVVKFLDSRIYGIGAVFTAKGPMPDSLQALTTQVWQEWFPTEGKNRQANDMATLEVYSVGDPQLPDYESGIWVPVK